MNTRRDPVQETPLNVSMTDGGLQAVMEIGGLPTIVLRDLAEVESLIEVLGQARAAMIEARGRLFGILMTD